MSAVNEEAFGRHVASSDNPRAGRRLGAVVRALLMRGGREVARHSGAMDARSIVAWTEANLSRL